MCKKHRKVCLKAIFGKKQKNFLLFVRMKRLVAFYSKVACKFYIKIICTKNFNLDNFRKLGFFQSPKLEIFILKIRYLYLFK